MFPFLPAYSALFPGTTAVHSTPFLCIAWTAFFSLPCKCTPPSPCLVLRRKEDQADELSEALARPWDSQYCVYLCPPIYLVYISTLEKSSISFMLYTNQLAGGGGCFLIFHFCLHSLSLLFYCSWLVQGSGLINNLFQGVLHFLTNPLLDFAVLLKHYSEISPAYVNN